MKVANRFVLTATLLVSATLPAYAGSVIIPPASATVAGNTSYALHDAVTVQQLYGASLLAGVPVGSEITGFQVRLAPFEATGPPSFMSTTNFQLDLGSSTAAVGSLSTNFAANEGSDTVNVYSDSLGIAHNSFPGGSSPNPIGPGVAFTAPYTYKGGDLLLTFTYTEWSGVTLLFDASNQSDAQMIQADGYNSSTATSSADGFALIIQLNFAPAAVPEPSSLVLAGIASSLGLCFLLRSRFKSHGSSLIEDAALGEECSDL
jgi:hypothetical protein